MSIKLKKLNEQVIVITGASSGIGLATAKMAAKAGAKVVLGSRNSEALKTVATEIRDAGGSVVTLVTDVADHTAVQRLAEKAVAEFGHIDTWVNNAGVSIYGKLDEVHLAEKRKLFETNFWGVVHGCRSALPFLRKQGGAIVNIGSVLSERAIPMQGIYSASKHAVKAYTDSLRMEVEAEGLPISVTLVKPAAINTPYPEHAQNHMDAHPTHQAPVYAPEVVAKAILDCAVHPRRDIFVGGSAKLYSLMETFLPRLTDLIMEKTMMDGQKTDELPKSDQDQSLFRSSRKHSAEVDGQYQGHVAKSSLYTNTVLHPWKTLTMAAGLGALAYAGIRFLQNTIEPDQADARTLDPATRASNRANRMDSSFSGITDGALHSVTPNSTAATNFANVTESEGQIPRH